ncbi:hypothetical protein N7539_007616 [Penicillium diatomitis]|uniref:DnaJ homologue subfamily C member 28 conserved domain-containing protein n=1 Tax=Penicillium diatomitis TaxID=2819901 RepID=A0A9X0BPC4_9EURO|nr:uncharacterized protein N7539_007616 [Penicillium diatomitis]KAJ5477472.1 hypothetical protein N7539_007616 [Penicillium diatomitis]
MSAHQVCRSSLGRMAVSARRNTTPTTTYFTTSFQHRDQSSTSSSAQSEIKSKTASSDEAEPSEGAMARRLSQMTEDAILEGGRAAQRNIENAGFSEDLKRRLEERVKAASFKSEHAAAHSILDMPSSAGQGTRETAAAPVWTGNETFQDTALRMLDDASKPIRTPFKIPRPVNLQPAAKPKRSTGARLAAAKDRTSKYTLSQAPDLSDDQRAAIRSEMQEKLMPGAQAMPISLQGLASLANERIEDAIVRGQFDKIKRGKGVNTETDHNANSAFIDTTEYFMNKIIQKQDIVPPWIEKQQELASEISRFRQRIRTEWRRHAARLIASQGGSLAAQMNRARGYAAAEARLAEQARIEAALRDTTSDEVVSEIASDGRIIPSQVAADHPPGDVTESQDEIPHLPPLRDESYIAIERSYLELAVKQINTIARSYNLQAPRSAQKPYINLDRELKACFAEVAPQLAEEIRRRASERARPSFIAPAPKSSVLGSFGTAQTVQVYEEDKTNGYGMKELWRDLFSKKS